MDTCFLVLPIVGVRQVARTHVACRMRILLPHVACALSYMGVACGMRDSIQATQFGQHVTTNRGLQSYDGRSTRFCQGK